jgi:uncharacterized protein YceK
MSLSRFILLAAVAFHASGCGTVCNIVEIPRPHLVGSGPQLNPRSFIYGGTANDASAIEMYLERESSDFSPLKAIALMVDTPLSAVGDTLTLPFTIPATRREARRWNELQVKIQDRMQELHKESDAEPERGVE